VRDQAITVHQRNPAGPNALRRSGSCMSLLTLEHSKVAYRLDLAVFGAASVGLGTLLFLAGPPARLITDGRPPRLAQNLVGIA